MLTRRAALGTGIAHAVADRAELAKVHQVVDCTGVRLDL